MGKVIVFGLIMFGLMAWFLATSSASKLSPNYYLKQKCENGVSYGIMPEFDKCNPPIQEAQR